ncbi:MAG: tryptophan--tRNA ligase [Candidatus Pacearchaeota archaeon]
MMGKNDDSNLNPWEVKEVKNYGDLMENLGVSDFSKYSTKLKNAPLEIKRGLILGHKDFNKTLEAINRRKKFAVMTGLMPSGSFHLGHMSVINQVIYYQKLGAKVYLAVADIEAQLTRNLTIEETRKIAIEEYLLNYIALGLSDKNLEFYFQSEGPKKNTKEYMNLSKLSSGKTTFNEIKNIYGELNPGKFTSALTQVADILYPQLDGFKVTITPVGFDQLPHANFTRDIASRMKFQMPGFTFNKLIPGLKGVNSKMSSSDKESYISFDDSEKEIERKIKKYAFSGGRETLKEHREKGGVPENDVSFQYLKFLFEEDDKKLQEIYNSYKEGILLTGELKEILIEKINAFLKEHRKKKIKARKQLHKYLID